MADERTLNYEPGIDGLRAVAVGLVLVFHGGFGWMRGGFLGVSVFFTLSGFLITRLLIDEHERSGSIGLRAFWGRRLRRLAPASLACIAAVILVAPWWTAAQRRSLRGDVWSTLAYVPNWRFAAAGRSYADLFATPSPLLHFWSLAIEEQFYVVFPLFAAGALALGRRWRRPLPVLGAALGLAWVASLLAAIATSDRDLVYYGTHTRAAEMLTGAALAVVVGRKERLRRVATPIRTIGPVALAAVIALAIRASIADDWLYDGRLAGFSVLSGAAVLASVTPGPVRRALAVGPLPLVGRVSYGLYLFHWPVFLLLDEQRTGMGRNALFVVRLSVTSIITAVSYVAIEQPVRRRRRLVPATMALGAWAAGVAMIAAAAPLASSTSVGARAAADVPDDVVRFEPPATTAPSILATAAASPGTISSTPPAPAATTPPPPLRVGFAGADLSVRARIRTIPGVQVVDLLTIGCPLASGELFPGCPPDTAAAIARALPDADAALVVLVVDHRDRAGLLGLEPSALLAQIKVVSRAFRSAGDTALAGGVPGLLLDTSGLDDALTMTMDQLDLAHPAARVIDSADLRAQIEAALPSGAGGGAVEVPASPEDGPPQVTASVPGQPVGVPATGGPPAGPGGRLKLIVIGDSTSYELSAAMARAVPEVEVTWAGGANCPIVDVEELRWWPGAQWPMDECPNIRSVWPDVFAEVRPDVVLIVSSLAEQSEHRYAGTPGWSLPGDEAYRRAHDDALAGLLELAAPTGAVVLVADAPPIVAGTFATSAMAQQPRIDGWNAQIAAWDTAWAPVETLPYAAAVASVEQLGPAREDGVHLAAGAADLVAQRIAPVIFEKVARLRRALVDSGCISGRTGELDLPRCRAATS